MASRSSSLLVSRPPHALASSQSPIFHPRTPCSAPAPLRSPRAKPARLIVSPAACRLSPTRPVATNEFSGASSRASSRNRRQRRNVSRAGIFNGWRAPPAESSIGAETTRRNAPDGAGGIVAQGERDGEGAGGEEGEGSAVRGEMGSSIADFLRLHEDAASQRVELQTAVLSYRRPARWWNALRPPVQVDLVSVVHIADQDYYDALQAELSTYDRVLYEMVADKQRASAAASATSRPAGGDADGEDAQRRDSRWRRFEERGESMLSFAREVALRSTKAIVRATAARPLAPNLGPLRRALLWAARFVPMPLVGLLVIEGVCAPEGPGSSALVKGAEFQALLNLDLSSALKVVLARQITLDTLDGAAGVMASSVIIGERNRACMQEVHEALKAGSRRIAVFYGSGHLPDMHLRLTTELGLEPSDLSWRTAWSIPTPAFAPLPAPPPPASSAAPPSDVNSVSAASTAASAAAAAGSSAAAAASPLGLPALPRPASRRTSPSLANPTMFSSANPTTTTPPTSPSSSIPTFHSPHLTHLSKQAHGLLDKSLSHLAGATGWPMTRQQTAALLLLSVVLALDLCLWEVVLASLSDLAVLLLGGVGQFLDQGWGL
ncbi:unnamed protein product [Closterium sp. NIES-53]